MRKLSGSLGFFLVVLLSGCSTNNVPKTTSTPAPAVHGLQGVVHGGQQPLTNATLKLMAAASTGDGMVATTLATVQTGGNGAFTLTGLYTCPGSDPYVYITATGGNPGLLPPTTNNPNVTMMATLTDCNTLKNNAATTFVYVDEVTTVGAVAALSQWMTPTGNLSYGSGDAAAFATAFGSVAEYTNTATGTAPGPSLPTGYYASSTEINTLGNILAACINTYGGVAADGTACGDLFLSTEVGGVAPTNTLGAMLNIINNPTQNASLLFNLASAVTPFQPVNSIAPSSWALPIELMAATPTFSIGGGTYGSAQFVTLSDATTGSVIYYTLDGSTPTNASTIYNGASGAITVSSSETIKAIAEASTYGPSAVQSAVYTITGSTQTYNVGGQVLLSNGCGSATPTITVNLTQGATLIQTTTTTNSNGSFSFSGVPVGTYTVTPSISGAASVFIPTNQSLTVTSSSSNFASFGVNLGYTVSGTVTYGGSQTGQTYLSLVPVGCGSFNAVGTSISNTGAYTIRGVPPGSYTVQAWMDPLGQGVQNAIDPTGSTSATVTSGNATVGAFALQNPTFTTPTSNPGIQTIVPNPEGALIVFSPSQNNNNEEDANQYVLQWSLNPTLGGGSDGTQFLSVAGSKTFTASGSKGVWVLTNASVSSGQTYYFQARSVDTLATNPSPSGWCNYTSTGCSGTTGFTAVTIAPPTCTGTCTTVTSSVTIPAGIVIKAGAPLYLGLLQFSSSGGDPSGFYVTEIASPTNGANSFTVTVPSGPYYAILGILDQNNNGGFGAGTISNVQNKVAANLAISGTTQNPAGITLPTANATATVATQFWSNTCMSCGSGGTATTGYQLAFTVNGLDKLPVAVTLNSGPNVLNNNGTVAVDMGICTECGNPQFQYSASLPGTPNVGDSYSFTVTYSDGSQDFGTTVTGAVTGWNGGSTVVGPSDAATALAPTNNSSTSTTPTFTWTDSTNATGANFNYSFNLGYSTCPGSGDCTIWQIPGNNSKSNGFSNTITSIPWITSGNDVTGTSGNLPTVTALTGGTTYNWEVQVQDSIGNEAQTQVQYQP